MTRQPQTIYIIRHAQGTNNLEPQEEHIGTRDPGLTDEGISNSKARREELPDQQSIELICASPLRRTIQTAESMLQPCLQRGLRITALPDLQESWDGPSDTGSELKSVKAEFGHELVDWQFVKDGWEVKEGEHAQNPTSLKGRALRLREWLKNRDERNIVVVGHGNFTHYITGDVDEDGNQTDGNWTNLEWRSYSFCDGTADLEETSSSLQRRGATN